MANVGGLPGGTAQPHHRSTRFADQDMETFTSPSATTEVLQTVSGMIADERQEPLADVEVFVPEFNLTSSTDRHGVFTLQVRAMPQRPVKLVARKGGYVTYRADATLGNTSFNFTMQRKSNAPARCALCAALGTCPASLWAQERWLRGR